MIFIAYWYSFDAPSYFLKTLLSAGSVPFGDGQRGHFYFVEYYLRSANTLRFHLNY